MTESGPISASQIDLSNYEHRFNPEHQTFAFFGSKEIIDILEAYFVFLGSDLDLTDFANNLNAAIRSQQVQRNPQLKTVLLMLNLKLQSALAYHQDKEIADGVVKILSSSVDEHEQQRFIEGLLASLKEELAYLAYLPFDEILNKLDLDRYVLLASPQLIDKLRYELEMKPKIITG